MLCPRCQAENPVDARFCEDCGSRLSLACPRCAAEVSPGKRFCRACGADLSAVPAGAAPGPASYTPKHLAEKILTSRGALEGERKQVTVLFADLKGSMELLADRDPEEARKLLDPVLERMMEAVHRYEGTVNQVMGDGIMALFGAPLAHEDHAVRACYAALDMQAALRRYGDELFRTQGVGALQIRVGLNSGEVVVRAIGSDLHMDYTAVGQTTHLAARMEQLARPGTTVLTADTLRLAEGYVEITSRGPVPVKGLDAPVEVFELTGAGPMRSRLQVAAGRGLTRFVGREAELEQLRLALGRAAAGHGQVLATVGEPGVGKSRLVWEVTHSHRIHGWVLMQAGSVSYGRATPYRPVIDLLKGYFAVEDRDDPRRIREKVVGRLLTLDRVLEPTLPAFLALLDVPDEDAPWQALDPLERRQQTLSAITGLLLRESRVQPLLVVFEDLHWIDAETQVLLDNLVARVPTARMLLLVTYRPEYQHDWGSRTYYAQLRLDPLPPESAEALLQGLLGASPDLESLKEILIAQTEGNPFFLEESVRALVEAGTLVGERGAYRLVRPLQGLQVPATVHAVLAARLDRLPPEEKALLQTASVIGKDVPLPLLRALADLPEETLRRHLASLRAAEFLYETSLFPEVEYTFKHALTHEVAYGSILEDRRRALYGRIVQVIETLYPDRLVEHVERLAHHALRGAVWDRALVYLRQAATKAIGRGALQEAVHYLEQAVATLDRLPHGPATLDEAIDLRLSLRNALYALGDHERTFTHLQAAERLATERGDPRRLARVLRYLSTHDMFMGEYARAAEAGQRAVQAAKASGDADLEVETRLGVAIIHIPRGEYRAAADALRRIATELQNEGPAPRLFGIILLSVTALGFLAAGQAERGEFTEAVDAAREAFRRSEAYDPPYSRAFAAWSLGYVAVRQGDSPQAIRVLEPALERCRVTGPPLVFPALASMLGLAFAMAAQPARALPLLEEAVAQRALGWVQSLPVACLAEGLLRAGQVTDANREAARALELARATGERGVEARAFHLLGDIAAHPAGFDPEQARTHYRCALSLADELGMRPLMAHCHLGLGKLSRRTGGLTKAQEHLTAAIAMYREMDMQSWLGKAEVELGPPDRGSA